MFKAKNNIKGIWKYFRTQGQTRNSGANWVKTKCPISLCDRIWLRFIGFLLQFPTWQAPLKLKLNFIYKAYVVMFVISIVSLEIFGFCLTEK